jgi:hypothetical protein
MLSLQTVFNLDKSKTVLSSSPNVIGQGSFSIYTRQINADDSETTISSVPLNFGQGSYSRLSENIVCAADDTFLLLRGQNANVYRIGINPSTYAITTLHSFPSVVQGGLLAIVSANRYAQFIPTHTETQEEEETEIAKKLNVYAFDDNKLSLEKEIFLDDILPDESEWTPEVCAISGKIALLYPRKLVLIDPDSEEIVSVAADFEFDLGKMGVKGNYLFVKPATCGVSQPIPLLLFSFDQDALTEISLAFNTYVPYGSIPGAIQSVLEGGILYLLYRTDSDNDFMMTIDLTKQTATLPFINSLPTGTQIEATVGFISPFRVFVSKTYSGTPGGTYRSVYKYAHTLICFDLKDNGNTYIISELKE